MIFYKSNLIQHTIIVVQNKTIVPEYKRKPSSNTLFYAPLIANATDTISWNNPNSTRWSFTYDWISCRFNSAAMQRAMKATMQASDNFTIFQILKPVEQRSYSQRIGYPYGMNFEHRVLRSDSWSPKFAMTEWSGSRARYNAREMPLNERHIRVSIRNWSGFAVYKDWQYKDYTWNNIRASWSSNTMRMSVNNYYDYYNWYVAHLWVEKWVRDEAYVQKFVRTFKSTYWIA